MAKTRMTYGIWRAYSIWASWWIASFESGGYKPLLPNPADRAVRAGRVPISRRLALKLARYHLHVWGEVTIARDGDVVPIRDPMSREQTPVKSRQTSCIDGGTLSMYVRVGADEFRPGDDPPEAAFYYLQVERLLNDLQLSVQPLKLSWLDWQFVAALRGETSVYQIAGLLGKHPADVARMAVVRGKDILAHQERVREVRAANGDSIERAYCTHRFVMGRACEKFPSGRSIEREVINCLADDITETWGSTIPQSVLREMQDKLASARRESETSRKQVARGNVPDSEGINGHLYT